ncbi:type I toxin-antitoxin system Ibs family toxin [Escherichia coli]|nr:type I toxin-antitoxin system Ibs family toxin [Escherichia coli]MBB7213798.1 type I toxin-antitoxin system Ibs family toxin [Escherichia coli]MBB7282444.1 type I toxin-antitoxin system Ibs family toxin [Escherichia coli]MBB8317127.1 type I toxin-antitoxin system Ibs family toxin [Escherichia coli]MBB8317128.1 type I toxin-antitoxin system Ibs family toxin [Escherichia coli]MCD6802829.1 type I toxin-antitoxin system Ibs family toxin [Escherichia coli]
MMKLLIIVVLLVISCPAY